jgi:hypothetical protein
MAVQTAIEIEIAGASGTLATKQDILILRHEMAEMRAELRHDLQAAMTGNLRHMYGAIMGQFALLLGLAYFLVGHIQR